MKNWIVDKKVRRDKVVRTLVIGVLILLNIPFPAFARTAQEIEQDIKSTEKELTTLSAELKAKEAQLKNATANKNSAQGELAKVIAEIDEIEIQLEVDRLKLDQMQAQLDKQNLEKEQTEEKQQKQLQSLYMYTKDNQDIATVFSSHDNPLMINYYMEIIAETDQEGLNSTYDTLANLNKDIEELQKSIGDMDKRGTELAARKKTLEESVVSLQKQESSYASGVKQLKPKVNATQEELKMLSSEQKALQDAEKKLLEGSAKGGTQKLEAGEYYFGGRGRDLYQGHGVGLSQFGAYGAARAGWSADSIVKHYYKGVTIAQGSGTVNIIGGRQGIPLEEYVAGIGEVPNKACGSAEQAASRPDKYILDNPSTVWDCWPEEAIKAQVIAARTYGLRNVNVYPDARSQVYTGTKNKQWAADETQGKVLKYNGALISAVYSSDNHNGWGTANNDTVWSNLAGDGTAYPYLRAVQDSATAYHFTWTDWTYRTNSYNFTELNSMLTYAATSSQISSSTRTYVAGIRSNIGELTAITFEKDPSGRVKKVKLTGTKGSRYIAGWAFKGIWNTWVGNVKPKGETDYIYSLTFSINKV